MHTDCVRCEVQTGFYIQMNVLRTSSFYMARSIRCQDLQGRQKHLWQTTSVYQF